MNFIHFPGLVTDQLILRQVEPADDNEIFLLRSDEAVNRYLDRPKADTIEDARAFIGKIINNKKGNELTYWAIVPKQEKKLIGTICLFNFVEETGKAEIGYELLPSFQGQGFMQEAMLKVIEFAFSTLNLQTIEAYTLSENSASLKLLEKNNFKRTQSGIWQLTLRQSGID